MNIAICFLTTIKDHFNLKVLKEQAKNSKLHNIDIYTYINDENIEYINDNDTIYFKYDYLRNKFNYKNYYCNSISNSRYNAGIQFLIWLDMYMNHKNKYDFYMFYEDDLAYFGEENLFDKINFDCDFLFQNKRKLVTDDHWTWWYDIFHQNIDESKPLYHGLLNIYGGKSFVIDKFIDFFVDKIAHHELLISYFVLNNNYKVNYINNYISLNCDWRNNVNFSNEYDLMHPIKTLYKYNLIKDLHNIASQI